jgi:hypothetical protein
MMKNYNVKKARISSPLAPGLRSMKVKELRIAIIPVPGMRV